MKHVFHSRSKFFACLLTFCAGFTDAYTFILRGETLVAGQTGNVVFLSVELIQRSASGVEVKLLTMLAFMLGIYLMTLFHEPFKQPLWRLGSIVPLVLMTTVVGFLPQTVPNLYLVPPLAFCMGIVATTFSQVDGIVYNHSFMTGNLKKTMVLFGTYTRTREAEVLAEGLFFLALLASFVGGAILSAGLISAWGVKTIWLVSIILFLFLAFRWWQYRQSRR